MDMSHADAGTMRAVTVSREYGSGGGEIAARLARRLQWQLIDHDVVVRVAQQLHVPEAEVEPHDERVESLAVRILESLRLLQPMLPPVIEPPQGITSRAVYEARCQVIDGAVAAGQVVIVGRGAQARLGQRPDAFHVRIVAPLETRAAYVMRREGLARTAALSRIEQKDAERRRYLQLYYQRQPGDPQLYDLILNTGALDLDGCVDLIALALGRKAQLLAAPPHERGPIAGLPPYPGEPEDFRPRQ